MKSLVQVAPELFAGITNDGDLVIMLDSADGEHMARVSDVGMLHSVLVALDATKDQGQPGLLTTAESDLEQRTCPYTHAHTRHWCGNRNCRES